MENKDTYIATDVCPSQAQLNDYAFGKLNNLQKHQIERHALNCKMCDDVIDGLLQLKSENQLVYSLNSINKKIEERIKPTRRLWYVGFSVAASVAMLVGVSVYFINSKKDALVQNTSIDNSSFKVSKDSIKQNSGDLGFVKNVLPTSESLEKINDSAIIDTKQEDLEQPKVENLMEQTVADGNVVDDIITEPKQSVAANDDAKKHEEKSNDVNSNTNFAQAQTSVKLAPSNSFNSPKIASTEAYELEAAYAKKDTRAKKALDMPLDDATIAKNNYLSGVGFMQQKNYAKAIKCFDVTLKYSTTQYFEDAQWQKANALLQNKEEKEAKKLLEQIAAQNGIHKTDAIEELEKIK